MYLQKTFKHTITVTILTQTPKNDYHRNYPKYTILVHFLVNRYGEFTKSSERGYSVL